MTGGGSADGRNPVELLAEEFVARLRRGEAATVEEYAEQHPHLASEIRRALTPLRLLEQAGREETAPEEPVTIAGYRIVREIGRGGMGVVYEADQLSLSRRVALKVLGATVSESPAHRERFRREAEAAARLHHTNIVPVFGAGEDGGRAYYVMQLIEGVTLREVLDAMHAMDRKVPFTGKPAAGRAAALLLKSAGKPPGARPEEGLRASRPDYFRRVAKLGMFVARALAHAHQRGILHRDIKPSNIMLDRTGAVWVTDFGLAKQLDREDLTATGDAVGTVRYMAPEQFHGAVDERSEIHTLGLTLHELLTLRPAFGDRRHAALMKKKLAGPPPSPRSLAPHLPRDLETIVRKACALEPRHRYPRAADLEDDLRRFLEGRPVAARRTRAPERLWRWARRNPVVAALGSATVLLLVAAVLVFAVSNRRTRRALDLVADEKGRVEEALRRLEEESEKAVASATLAKKESARAEENLGVALEAFDRILRNLSSRGAPGSLDLVLDREVSGVTPADVELLTTLQDFFERFADRNQVDLGTESAKALTQVGDIQRKLGRLSDSIASYRKALAAYRSLASESGAADLALEQAKILNAIATTQSRAGVIREAFGTYREARRLLQGDPAADRADFRFELARNLVLVATVGERTGMRHEDSSDVGERGGRGRPGRGGRRGGNGRSAHLDSAGEAIEILTGLLRQDPKKPEYRFLLVRAHRARVPTAAGEEESTGEESALLAAIREADRLVREFPEAPAFHYELADTLATRMEGDETFAARIDRAAGICLDLIGRHPDMPEFQDLAGRCLAGKAGQLAEDGELSAAVQEYERALNHLRPGADRFPSVLSLQRSCAEALAGLAEVRVRLGDPTAATALLDEAVRRVDAFRGQSTTARPVLANLLSELRGKRAELEGR